METKLQSFQFKVIHRIMAHKKLLYKMNISTSEMCNYCTNEIETIEHKLYSCNEAHIFWITFETWWNHIFGSQNNISLSCQDIIFGIMETGMQTLNFCILVAKYFINQKKYNNQQLYFPSFKIYLKSKLEIIKHILFTKGNHDMTSSIKSGCPYFCIFSNSI